MVGEYLADIDAIDLHAEPGVYPVRLTLARYPGQDFDRVAYASLVVSDAATVRWQPTSVIAVDGGTTTFTSAEGASLLVTAAESGTGSESQDSAWDSLAAHDYLGTESAIEGSINLVMTSSGVGDGGYQVFVGYDSAGQPTRVVVDFLLVHLDWPTVQHARRHHTCMSLLVQRGELNPLSRSHRREIEAGGRWVAFGQPDPDELVAEIDRAWGQVARHVPEGPVVPAPGVRSSSSSWSAATRRTSRRSMPCRTCAASRSPGPGAVGSTSGPSRSSSRSRSSSVPRTMAVSTPCSAAIPCSSRWPSGATATTTSRRSAGCR